ncbi:MAG TPA: Uma2 family endonuclease [Dehalococcoidia bacterium]|nr:Uma2 family endonuclease [Dehalococcoidia bacterium]
MTEISLVRRRFTVDEYEKMTEAGVLYPEDHVELLAGEIVQMAAEGVRHMSCILHANRWFSAQASESAVILVQSPIKISEHAMPEPDIALLRLEPSLYATRHPEPRDVLLLIEVSDSSIGRDHAVKLPLYAGAAIYEVWIVDLTTDAVEVYRDPSAAGYREMERFGRGATIAVSALPALQVPVDKILP